MHLGWDDGKENNLRMRIEEEGFETGIYPADWCEASEEEGDFTPLITLPHFLLGYPTTNAYLSWAPSHSEFCLLTEVLTYANLINGIKPELRKSSEQIF